MQEGGDRRGRRERRPRCGGGCLDGLTPEQLALVAEGCNRSGVVWLRPEGAVGHRLAWHVWHDGAVHVVAGGGEQELPPLEGVVEVVVPSKDAGSRLATVAARAERLWPGTSQWATAAQVLAAKRLNEHSDPPTRSNSATGGRGTRRSPGWSPCALLAAGEGAAGRPRGVRRPGPRRRDDRPPPLPPRRPAPPARTSSAPREPPGSAPAPSRTACAARARDSTALA